MTTDEIGKTDFTKAESLLKEWQGAILNKSTKEIVEQHKKEYLDEVKQYFKPKE